MGALAIADLILGLMGKLNVGVEEGLRFYRAVKQKNNDLPERTDMEVIEIMRAGFQGNVDDIKASLDALHSTDEG